MQFVLPLFVLIALTFFQTPTPADAAGGCPQGSVPFALVSAGLLAHGITIMPDANGCVFQQSLDSALLSGGCASEAAAKEFLKTRTENKKSIEGLQPQFACNLMKFITAADASGLGKITISVGTYEVKASVATHGVEYCQRRQCKEGTNSHPLGLAADLLYNGQKGPGSKYPSNESSAWCQQNPLCKWAHQNATNFGLMFRLMPESGCKAGYYEPWHIELKGVAGCQGTLPSSPSGSPTIPASTAGSPSSNLSDIVRRALYTTEASPLASTPAETNPLKTAQESFNPTYVTEKVDANVTTDPTAAAAQKLKDYAFNTVPGADPRKAQEAVLKTAADISGDKGFLVPLEKSPELSEKPVGIPSYTVPASFAEKAITPTPTLLETTVQFLKPVVTPFNYPDGRTSIGSTEYEI